MNTDLSNAALPVGATVVFREGTVEHLGKVLEILPGGMAKIGVEEFEPGRWVAKAVPVQAITML